MSTLTSKLSYDLRIALRNADEIWIAVGLMNFKGCNFILQSIPKNCICNFTVGVDLPTDPASLDILLKRKIINNITPKIITEKGNFFHPKVYVIRSQNRYQGYIGSANCTNGGFDKNVEMTIKVNEQTVCKELIEWYNKLNGQTLTRKFIEKYKPQYAKRIVRKKKDQEEIESLKEQENKEVTARIKNRRKLIKKIEEFKHSPEYKRTKMHSEDTVKNLREYMNIPDFNGINDMKLKAFCDEKNLGTIRYGVMKIIRKNKNKFIRLMKFVCDKNKPIDERIDEALNGKMSIKGIKMAFISKILCVHNPKEFFVLNTPSKKALEYFEVKYSKGTMGEKYEIIRKELKRIMNETKIDNFAVLDGFFWNIQDEMQESR